MRFKNSGHSIKVFLSGGGGREFQNIHVKNILQQEGISCRISMPYIPEQNGAPERENRTLVENARCLIHARELPLKLLTLLLMCSTSMAQHLLMQKSF